MNQVLFGSITVAHIVAAVVLIIGLGVLKKMFTPKEDSAHVVQARCGCGWSGQASKYKPVCPKCAKPLRV